MKQLLLISVFLIYIIGQTFSQVVTAKSNTVTLKVEPKYEFTLPPNLFVNMEFSDDNSNGIIEANESAKLFLEFTNKGGGPAQGLKINLNSDIYDPNFIIGNEITIKSIAPGENKKIEIPLKADFNVKTAEHKIEITVTEYFGYDMDPALLVVNTLEYQKPQIVYSGMDIYDTGEGTMSIIADGQLQPGEMVNVKIFVQNIGNNVALESKYSIISKDENIRIVNGSGDLGNLAIGEVKEINLTISPNKRVNYNDALPIFITVTEKIGKGSMYDRQLPLALNQQPQKSEPVVVNADFAKMNKQVARFEYKSDKYTSNMAAKNIAAVPISKTKRPDAVAVVIGVENYENLPDAPYAAKDAEVMSKYFKDVLGVENVITHLNEEVSGFFFINIFDDKTGKLQKMINKGETEVFVYYSGHGIPEKDGNDVYLFPSDGNLEQLELMGYSLNKLYKNLDALGAKSVTVILDACFTGSSRVSNTYVAENVSNTKGVIIKPRAIQPWQTNPNFRVFASSRDDQTSLGFDEAGTGLFTYYLAIGLQGEADLNKDKTIEARELINFVTDNVKATSVRIRGEQTPQFYGNSDFKIVEF